MRARVTVLALLIATAAAAGELVLQPPAERVLLDHVHDGDTLSVWRDLEDVRLNGIDAPEILGKCETERTAAKAARDRLHALLAGAKRVELRCAEREKYGRLLCRISADGHDVGDQLVAEGHARSYDGGARKGWCP